MNATLDPPGTDESPIDPRFEERRLAVAKAAGRRKLRWIVAGAVVVLLLVGASLLVRAPFLSVTEVTVSGATYTDPGALQAIVASIDGEPMLLLDEGALEARLEALPWVRRARVQRDWPQGVTIELAERTPLAVYGGADGLWHVVDTDGVVVAKLEGRPVDVLLLVGEGPVLEPGQRVPEHLDGAVRVARALPPTLKARTGEMAVDADGNLELHLQPQGTVLLGPPDAIRDKLIAALTVLGKLDPASVGVVDVRAPADPVTEPAGAGDAAPDLSPAPSPGPAVGDQSLTEPPA
jgi:cell division protein FtsQ